MDDLGAIVIAVDFVQMKKDEPVKLALTLQMYDSTWKCLYFDLDMIPVLFEMFSYLEDCCNHRSCDFMHTTLICKREEVYRESPLGLMRMPYKVTAIRSNIHQEWLDVQ